MPDVFNPIKGVSTSEATVDSHPIPVPSGYTCNISDVSDSNAGRTEDTMMHKNMLGSCVHIGLEWSYVDPSTAQTIMTAFAPEYFYCKYLDVRDGTYHTAVFYSGDKAATITQTSVGVRYTLSFNIIERTAK